jgi:hypothetical protein
VIGTNWSAPEAPLVSAYRNPDRSVVDRAIRQYLSPKATATKRAQTLVDHDILVGGYIITPQKKVKPAIFPVETEIALDDGPTTRGFIATSSNKSDTTSPQIMGDLTKSFFTVISGQSIGTVPELFSKNTGRPFTLADIETTAPSLFAALSNDNENGAGVSANEEGEAAPAAAPPALHYRILCLPLAMPIVYGRPVYRGIINDECVEAMERNIESSVFWLQGVESWNEHFHRAIVDNNEALGTRVPAIAARAEISKVISPSPYVHQDTVDEDDEETTDILDNLRKRLFLVKSSAAQPSGRPVAPTDLEIPLGASADDASMMTDINADSQKYAAIPKKPKVQIATYTEDENLVAKIQLAFAGYDSKSKEIHLARLSEEMMYVLAIQGKENRNRALASTLVLCQ